MQWEAIGCSAIGTKHIKSGIVCQDAVDYEIIDDAQVIIGVVSDGMGSARHSDIGSKLAVKTALSEIKSINFWSDRPKNDEQVRNVFCSVLKAIKEALKNQAENEGYPVEELNCTLLAFVATPTWLAAMQVGDGLIVVRPKSDNYQLLFIPDKGEYDNTTTSITSSKSIEEMQVCFNEHSYEFICAATDGIEKISLVIPENWKPFEGFFKPLEEQIMLSSNPQSKKQIEIDDFLNSEKINQETDDDKTLLLCVYNDFSCYQKTRTLTQRNTLTPSDTKSNKMLYIKQSIQNCISSKIANHNYDITPKITIGKDELVCCLLSNSNFKDHKEELSKIVHQAVIDSPILEERKIKKIQIYNSKELIDNKILSYLFSYWLFSYWFLELDLELNLDRSKQNYKSRKLWFWR